MRGPLLAPLVACGFPTGSASALARGRTVGVDRWRGPGRVLCRLLGGPHRHQRLPAPAHPQAPRRGQRRRVVKRALLAHSFRRDRIITLVERQASEAAIARVRSSVVEPPRLPLHLSRDGASQAVRRLVGALLCATLVTYGCTTSPVRPPLKTLPADLRVGNLAVGLLDIAEAIPPTSADAERIMLSLPDEFLVRDGDGWAMALSRVVVQPKDLVLVSLQAAGVRATGYNSLHAARAGGADVVIACVLRQARVRSGTAGLFGRGERRVEAVVEMQTLIVDARSSRHLWSGTLESKLSMDPGIWLPPNFAIESQALSFLGELRAQSMRALMTQAFYHVSMDLVVILDRITPR